jgi:hypothetical protein
MPNIINNYVLSTGFMGLRVIPQFTDLYFTYFDSDDFLKLQSSVCSGVTMEGISNTLLNKLDIPHFTAGQAKYFNSQCADILKQRYGLQLENERLKELKQKYLEKFF